MDKHKQANGHSTPDNMDELSDEKWADFEKEVHKYCGDHWINRKTSGEEAPTTQTNNNSAKSKGDTWDFPLSLMNNAYIFKNVLIQDKEFHRQLNAEDPFEICSHKVQESTCSCGYVEKIKKCTKCQKMFCWKCHPDSGSSTLPQENQKQKPQQKGGKQSMPTSGLSNQQKIGSDVPIGGAFPHPQGYSQPPGGSFNNSHGIYIAAPVRIPRDPYSAQNQMGQSQLGYYPSLNPMHANMFQGQMPQINQQVNAGPKPKEAPFKHSASPIIPVAVAPIAMQTNAHKNRNYKENNPRTKDSTPFQNRVAQNFPDPAQFGPWVIQTATGSNIQRNDVGGVHQSKHLYYQKPNQDRSSEEMARKAFVTEKPGGKERFIGKDLQYSQRNSMMSPRKIDDILNRVENKGQMQNRADNNEILQGFARMDLSEVDNKQSKNISIVESAVSYNTSPLKSCDTLINLSSEPNSPEERENSLQINSDILSLLQDAMGNFDDSSEPNNVTEINKTVDEFEDDVQHVESSSSWSDEMEKQDSNENAKKSDKESSFDIDSEPLVNPFKAAAEVKKTTTEDKKSPIIPQIPLKFGIGNRKPFSLVKKPVIERQKFPTLGDLKRGPNVTSLMTNKESVFITHFYSFNKVHIISADAFHHDFPLLKEDIFEAVSAGEGGKSFEYLPEVGTVLLAPLNGQYNRAVVEEICFDTFVVVRFIDIGSTTRLRLGSVYQISKEILDVPILGAEVYLKDVTEHEMDMILLSDFNKFVNKWPINRPCVVKFVEKVNGEDYVKLDFSLNGVTNSVSGKIIGLGKWEWQRRWETTPGITERELCSESHWKVNCFENQLRRLEVGVKTKGRVATSTPDSAEIAFLLNVEGEYYYRDKQVFQKQLEKYVHVVNGDSKFFPALNEYLFVKIEPNEDEDLQNLRGIGKWSRCVRSDSVLINLDECECYPVSMDYRNIVKVRKYCPDFSKIPLFMTNCRIKDCLPFDEKTQSIFNNLAQPGNVLTFCALDPTGFNVHCEEYERLCD